jgi:uncharacterized membrane protein (UPF0127 family)
MIVTTRVRIWRLALFLLALAVSFPPIGCDGFETKRNAPVLESLSATTTPDSGFPDQQIQLTVMRDKALLLIGEIEFRLELADTNTERAEGLMGRTTLAEREGMLFIFDTEEKWSLWMKQTLIPLDGIWISRSGRIEHIQTMNPEPGVEDTQLTIYTPDVDCLYVIELNAGAALSAGLTVGLRFQIEDSSH